MPSKRTLLGISILILTGLIFYVIVGPELGKQGLDLNETKSKVLSDVKAQKEYVNKTAKWMEEEGEQDIGYFHPPLDDSKSIDQRKDVLNYFVTGLLENDLDIFLSSFNPESISKDLFKSNVQDKVLVAEDIMERISRKNQIEDIKYKIKKGKINTEFNKISVTITYKDKEKAAFILDIKPVIDSHHEGESVYVITTSVWNIIEKIESSCSLVKKFDRNEK
ncbi:hypothetical protein [Mesobacillus zeae]|uniref:hypothetical protein n=1 Tax=Mesobacillus zeae TaxID=1917180 RepID=UPI00300A194D